jgi:hypothetical protein
MIKKTIQIFTIVVISIFVVSCSHKVKSTLGITTSGPDEYSVSTNKPLEMPPHFTLNEVMNKTSDSHEKDVSVSDSLSAEQKELLKEIE